MCGIGAFCLHPDDHKRIDTVRLAQALLAENEVRGRDASGAAWTTDGEVWWHKAAERGSVYAKQVPLDPRATVAILHTRAATSGDPRRNENNHPHVLPGVTGVHNGVIRNYREVMGQLGVAAQSRCDSEAIFALLAHGKGKRIELLPKLRGDAAIAWLETDTPTSLRLARLSGRPMWIGQTEVGSTIMASTEPILRNACRRAGVILKDLFSVPEWTYLRVQNGVIHDYLQMRRPAWDVPAPKFATRPYRGTGASTPVGRWHDRDLDEWAAPAPWTLDEALALMSEES